MSLIVPCSIVVLVNRWRVYLTVCANNLSDEFMYLVSNFLCDYKVGCKMCCL